MKTQGERVWHYIKPNETTRIPRRHIILDTESVEHRIPNGHVQTWRLAAVCLYRCEPGRKPSTRWIDYDEPDKLWQDITSFTHSHGRTIVWTHNLQYDLRISDALNQLTKLGWQLESHNFTPRNTWLIWRRESATLVMVDSLSVYPVPLSTVGKCFGIGKLALPSHTADRSEWLRRCGRDVTILFKAVTSYLEWLEKEDLGNWQMTGSGQVWAAFRHRFMHHKMLVHADDEALAAERRAMWTGRCEAYWHGKMDREVVHEWDMTLAYPSIARDCPVPVRLMGPMPNLDTWRQWLDNPNVALLADVTITTPAPVVPAAHEGRVLWPVGTFSTTLWDPEIKAALDAGASVTVHRGWLYRARPALRDWAQWVIDQLDDVDNEVPAWRKLILKNWARALIGRMAMTYQGWEPFADSPNLGLSRSPCMDVDTGESYELMQVGTSVWRSIGRQDWDQSLPMVTGYVQSVARVRIWTIIHALPPKSVLYCDTDSILVIDEWSHRVADVAAKYPEFRLRLKRSWDGFAIYGPRQIVTGERVRISGIPLTARKVEDRVFEGEVWDSLTTSLRQGHTDAVTIRDRTWHARGVDRRREGPDMGWTSARTLPESADQGVSPTTTGVVP